MGLCRLTRADIGTQVMVNLCIRFRLGQARPATFNLRLAPYLCTSPPHTHSYRNSSAPPPTPAKEEETCEKKFCECKLWVSSRPILTSPPTSSFPQPLV
jgi:hypothetical protein